MKKYRHNNVTIRVYGSACHATIKDATIKFLSKVEMYKAKQEEQHKNVNINKSRNI